MEHKKIRGRKRVKISLFIFAAIAALYFTIYTIASPTDMEISSNTTWTSDTEIDGTLTILNDCTLTLDSSVGAKVLIVTATNIVVGSGAYISSNGKGSAGGSTDSDGVGTGAGLAGDAGKAGGGAGYGAAGGDGESNVSSGGALYGSSEGPTHLGSGGGGANSGTGGAGGGAMKLVVSGTLTNGGTVSANGADGSASGAAGGGGGSGGSILVQAGAIDGAGTFTVNGGAGGTGSSYEGGGGACGRITLYYENSYFTGSYALIGGTGSTSGGSGSETTYYPSVPIIITVTMDSDAPGPPTLSSIAFTAVGGVVVANTLNTTNTNFAATATIVAGEATGGSAELLKGGASFSTPIIDNSIVAGDTSVSFDAGLTTNAAVQTAFASGAVVSVKLTNAADTYTVSAVGNPTITTDYTNPSAPITITVTMDHTPPNAPGMGDFTATGGTVLANTLNGTNTGFTLKFISPATEYAGTAHLYVGGVLLANDVTEPVSTASFEYTLTGNAQSIADLGVDGTKELSVRIIDDAGNIGAASAGVSITRDLISPTVSDEKISIEFIGTGAGGVYIVGNTVTAEWDNTADTGDANTDISTVTCDFSSLGGGSAVSMTNASDTWTGSYVIATTSNTGTWTVDLTATDNAGNTTNTADTTDIVVGAGSLILDAPDPTLAGQEFCVGATQSIEWTAAGDITSVNIAYSTDSGSEGTYTNAISTEDSSTGANSYNWTIPYDLNTTSRLKISDAAQSAVITVSTVDFSIVSPTITLTSPDGAESGSNGGWYSKAAKEVTWTTVGSIGTDSINLYYSNQSGSTDPTDTYTHEISLAQADDGSYTWTLPFEADYVDQNVYKVKVEAVFSAGLTDTTDADFDAGTLSDTAASVGALKLAGYEMYILPITITDNTGEITAVNDIRIIIPDTLNMTWNAADTTATITGSAAARVSTTVSYEGSNKILVIDVTTDFIAGDSIVVSWLSFNNFSAVSAADNLRLDPYNAGYAYTIDSKSIEVKSASSAFIGGTGDGWDYDQSGDLVLS